MAAATGYSLTGPTTIGRYSGAVYTIALDPPGSTQATDLVLIVSVDGASPNGLLPATVTLNTAHPSHTTGLLVGGIAPGGHTFMASQDGIQGATLAVTVTTGSGSSGTGSGSSPIYKPS